MNEEIRRRIKITDIARKLPKLNGSGRSILPADKVAYEAKNYVLEEREWIDPNVRWIDQPLKVVGSLWMRAPQIKLLWGGL